jgi:hypothetical protein
MTGSAALRCLCLCALIGLMACTPFAAPPAALPAALPTPTPLPPPPQTPPPTLTPAPNAAPPLAEILATYTRIRAAVKDNDYEAVRKAVEAYGETLKGKQIRGCDGWVANVYPRDDGPQVAIYLSDPFSDPVPPTQPPDDRGNVDQLPQPSVMLPVPATLVGSLQPGQHVRWSGTLTDLRDYFDLALSISDGQIDQVDGPLVQAAPTLPVPSASTQPTVLSAAPGLGVAPPLAEIAAQVQHLPEDRRADYLPELEGKLLQNSPAWILGVDSTIILAASDPFAAPSRTPPPKPCCPYELDYPLKIHMTVPAPGAAPGLQVGQHVQVSGQIHVNTNNPYDPVLEILRPTVTVLEDRLADRQAPADLQGALIRLARGACFGSCPVYTVTVYGDGTVVWQGESYVQVPGSRITRISPDRVRDLIALFQKVNGTALGTSYDHYMMTDSSSARTTLVVQGQAKTISHYHGDWSAPARLDILEDLIDQVLNTAQWIGTR